MKAFISFVIVSCLFCCCNNNNSGTYNTTGNIQAEYTSNDSVVNNDTVYDSYDTSNNNEEAVASSDDIVGYWTEYRTDDDAYLLGHYLFNANGTGSWILTGGLDNDMDNRDTINFKWYQDESGNIVTETEKGETEVLSFENGFIVKPSVSGNEIYKRDDIVSPL